MPFLYFVSQFVVLSVSVNSDACRPLSSVVRPHTENKRTVLQCSGDFDFGSVNFRSTQPETVSDDVWQSTSITSDAAPMTDNCMNTRDT